MKSTRKLDALVAEKVMGWRHDPDTYEGSRYLLDPAGARSAIPNYSTDIAAAWEVVGRIGRNPCGFAFRLEAVEPDNWACEMPTRDIRGRVTVNADTAPLAICLAALKAVGVEL